MYMTVIIKIEFIVCTSVALWDKCPTFILISKYEMNTLIMCSIYCITYIHACMFFPQNSLHVFHNSNKTFDFGVRVDHQQLVGTSYVLLSDVFFRCGVIRMKKVMCINKIRFVNLYVVLIA